MNSRVLSVLNLIGCLALTGMVVAQWLRERTLDGEIGDLKSRIATAQQQSVREAEQRAMLERDITVLKESLEATQHAAESAARDLSAKEQQVTKLEAEITVAREQLTAWEDAVKQRDERIRAIEEELRKTRARLDEAVKRLKEAAER